MSIGNVLIYIALIVYILYGKARGRPMKTPKRLFLLPVLLIILGYGDATHGTMKPLEVTLTVIGGAVSLGLGLLRGRADKISTRDGAQFVQWGALSFALFATNLVVKLIFDAVGVATGSAFSAVGKTLVLTLGLTLLGEAIALLLRSGAATGLLNSDGPGPVPPRRIPTDSFGAPGWLRQQAGQQRPSQFGPSPETTDSNTYSLSPTMTDDAWSNRHDHHDHHDHHHNHHGLTGPS